MGVTYRRFKQAWEAFLFCADSLGGMACGRVPTAAGIIVAMKATRLHRARDDHGRAFPPFRVARRMVQHLFYF